MVSLCLGLACCCSDAFHMAIWPKCTNILQYSLNDFVLKHCEIIFLIIRVEVKIWGFLAMFFPANRSVLKVSHFKPSSFWGTPMLGNPHMAKLLWNFDITNLNCCPRARAGFFHHGCFPLPSGIDLVKWECLKMGHTGNMMKPWDRWWETMGC